MEYTIKIFSRISSIYQQVIAVRNWQFSKFTELPENESGELMRRYIAKRSINCVCRGDIIFWSYRNNPGFPYHYSMHSNAINGS
jgi:hypothetical protein